MKQSFAFGWGDGDGKGQFDNEVLERTRAGKKKFEQ
jgi:hypothetical protein